MRIIAITAIMLLIVHLVFMYSEQLFGTTLLACVVSICTIGVLLSLPLVHFSIE